MAALTRSELRELVGRLQAGDYTDSDALDRDSIRLRDSVPHPEVLGLIFYPEQHFAQEPTPDEIVDRALSYRPVEL